MADDIERLQWYILNKLDRDEQEKSQVINSILDERNEDRLDVIDAFRELKNDKFVEQADSSSYKYRLTKKGEVKILFHGSSIISAIDFVGIQHKTELDDFLIELLDKDEPPDERTASGWGVAFSLSSQDWGELEINSEIFDSVKVQTVFYNNIPLSYYLIIYGEMNSDYLFDILQDSESNFGSARGEMREIWDSRFEDFPHTMVSNYPDSKDIVGRSIPVTVNTIYLDNRINEAITGERDVSNPEYLKRYYASHLSRNGLFEMFDINPRKKKSIFSKWANGLVILGREKRFSPDNKKYHANYTIVELNSQLVGEPLMPPASVLRLGDDLYKRILPLLYLYNWSKIKEREFWEINQEIRELALEDVDVNANVRHTQRDLRRLLDSELDFSDRYSRIKYHQSITENYFDYLEDWLEDEAPPEFPIPEPRVTRTPDEEVTGVFIDLVEDTKEQLNDTFELYEDLNERFSVTSTSLNRLLSLQSSATNIQINNIIRDLTVVLVFIAVAEWFGIDRWVSQNAENLFSTIVLILVISFAWYLKRSN